MSVTFMDGVLSSIADRGRALLDLDRKPRAQKPTPSELADALLSSRGEASGVALASELLRAFESMDEGGKLSFLKMLVSDFGAELEMVDDAIADYREDRNSATALRLHTAAEPRRQEIIRRLNLAPGGTRALVAMRAFLLEKLERHPDLKPLDDDFHHLLSSWFNRGFLVMRRIDWNTPASILEKIIRYEAVHAIDDWADLRRRIDPPDRRCFGFFHPALVDEPLIFVEVALTRGMPDAIAPIIEREREPLSADEADTAVFYSISNCQVGLRGVSFGNFLIKQVVEDLRRDLPRLKTFVTLSPAPGFVRWLSAAAEKADGLNERERTLVGALSTGQWLSDDDRAEAARNSLMPLAAHYFLKAKSRGNPVDPVARFHLGNGARLERINWMGDVSDKGMRQGAGVMVNYLYALADIEQNHEAYAVRQQVVASNAVAKLLDARSTRTQK